MQGVTALPNQPRPSEFVSDKSAFRNVRTDLSGHDANKPL
jgi:hypothetical protein